MKKVILVDDDDNIRMLAEMSLEDDFDLVVVSSGEQALQEAQTQMPDLILLDMMMPNMDGKETLEKLRQCQTTASVPVIFMTAKVQRHEVEEYLKLGIAGVIIKPFDPISLPGQICNIMHWDNASVAK